MPQAGHYELLDLLGQGGTADVWRARASDGVVVAVKVLRSEALANPALVEDLRAEARLSALLDHPHIVRLLDTGRVGPGQGLPEGAPWIAMELATATVAQRRDAPMADVLRGVLLALAHAHAHGLLHRDVKPDNVLVFDGATAPYRLSDFGIASRLDPTRRAVLVAGTPGYMAPELRRGALALAGPWSDLYSVGCLAWALLHGIGPPRAELPPLAEPDPGLQAWLDAMTHPDPVRRYRHARDALDGLNGVPGGSWRTRRPPAMPTPAMTTGRGTLAGLLDDDPAEVPSRDVTPAPAPGRPRWTDATSDPGATSSAGPGLFGIRPLPLVGRDAELERLRAALRRALAGHGPVCVLIRGESGVGKSRLAATVATEGAERGAAQPFLARHSPLGGIDDGLDAMVGRALGVAERTGEALLREHLESGEVEEPDALVELLLPDAQPVRLRTPELRHALVARTLRRVAGQRVALICLEDVAWGADALRFVHGGLAPLGPHTLLVATVEPAALAERPLEDRLLAGLFTEVIDLAPLGTDATAELVRRSLALAPDAVQAVVDRAAGQPVFVAALLQDWLARGALSPSERGLSFRGDLSTEPQDLEVLWRRRALRLPDEDSAALTLALILGPVVDLAEWREAAGHHFPGEEPSFDPGVLVKGGFLRDMAGYGGRRFDVAHRSLGRAVLSALPAEAIADLHRTAAAVLADDSTAATSRRRSEHRLAAGDLEEAIFDVFVSFFVVMHRDTQEAAAWASRLTSTLEDAGATAAAWTTRILEAHANSMLGVTDGEVETFDRGVRWAREAGDDQLLTLALYLRAHQILANRDPEGLERSKRDLREARDRLAGIPRPYVMPVNIEMQLARAHGLSGEVAVAIRTLEEVDVDALSSGHQLGLLNELATWLMRSERYDDAQVTADRALAIVESSPGTEHSRMLQIQGLLAEAREDWAAAEHWTRRAIDLRAQLQVPSPIGSVNLAELVAARGGVDEAEELLARARPIPPQAQGTEKCALAAIHAARGAWTELAAPIAWLEEHSERGPTLPPSLAYAMSCAARAGEKALARRIRALALPSAHLADQSSPTKRST